MKPVAKGLLIGCGVLFVAGVIAIIVVGRRIGANKDRLLAEGEVIRAEGREYGRTTIASACLPKAMGIYRDHTPKTGELRARFWLMGCLESSTPQSELCEGVPRWSEITRTTNWRRDQCVSLGHNGDERCTRIVAEVQRYCHKR